MRASPDTRLYSVSRATGARQSPEGPAPLTPPSRAEVARRSSPSRQPLPGELPSVPSRQPGLSKKTRKRLVGLRSGGAQGATSKPHHPLLLIAGLSTLVFTGAASRRWA